MSIAQSWLKGWLALCLLTAAHVAFAGSLIKTVAGGGIGDGGPATAAPIHFSCIPPCGVALDGAGNLYFADPGHHRIRRVAPNGTITTVAGNGTLGFSGDGGPATAAALAAPSGLALDGTGNLYIADSANQRIRKVDAGGAITTVAGNGDWAFSGDGGPATAAALANPTGVAVDSAGNLYVADYDNFRVRKVAPSGTIATVAGNGDWSFSGDGGPATAAGMSHPGGVALDRVGNLYIADTSNARIRKVAPDGTITTVAGSVWSFSGDGGPATAAGLSYPTSVALDGTGNLYIVDTGNFRIRKVAPDGTITTVAGNGFWSFSGDGGPATAAALAEPYGVALDNAGNLYIVDASNQRIRKVGPDGTITTVAGNGFWSFSGDGGPATAAGLSHPARVALDGAGNLYIADTDNLRIRKVAPNGTIITVAGNGTAGYSGDGGLATAAALDRPSGVAVDSPGNLYIADTGNNRIRKVASNGIITTVAGNGTAGFSGDNGLATAAGLQAPMGVALDGAGNLYIADSSNRCIRKVTPDGIITTVYIASYASRGVAPGRSSTREGAVRDAGDRGSAIPAQRPTLGPPPGPFDVAADGPGNLYIADWRSALILKVDTGGTITTVAGNGTTGFSGDNGPANAAALSGPFAVAVDNDGNLYIADTWNNRIRKVDQGGIITTVAGNGEAGFSGDGGSATTAALARPTGLAVDAAGNLYISDTDNNRIRQVYTMTAPTAGLSLRDAKYYYNVDPSSLGYVGWHGECSMTMMVLDVVSGTVNVQFDRNGAWEVYKDLIGADDAMFAYSLYNAGNQGFVLSPASGPAEVTAFFYCFSSSNGSVPRVSLLDAKYDYHADPSPLGRVGWHGACAMTMMVLDVNAGAVSLQFDRNGESETYKDHIIADDSMFAYSLYNPGEQAFVISPAPSPASVTAFFYCFSAQ